MAKRAVNQASINQTELKRIKIPLPPLPEQQKIAEILSTADDEIQKMDEQIALAEQLKKGLMQKLLTRGIGHTRFKTTEIGEIPEEWEIKKIKDISTYVTDGTHKTPHYIEEAQSGVPFISTENIKPYSNEFDFSRYKRYIDEISYKELSKRAKPEKGDLLISKCGTIGRTQLIRNDIKIGIFVGLLLVKIKNNTVSGQYFEDLLNSDKYRTIMESISPGSTRKTLAIGMFKNILIPLPPLQEQQKIAEILTTVDNKLELLGNKREKLNVLKKGLMDDLLTGKVRVKV
jgi:type I restriction enzyme S subunit